MGSEHVPVTNPIAFIPSLGHSIKTTLLGFWLFTEDRLSVACLATPYIVFTTGILERSASCQLIAFLPACAATMSPMTYKIKIVTITPIPGKSRKVPSSKLDPIPPSPRIKPSIYVNRNRNITKVAMIGIKTKNPAAILLQIWPSIL